MSNTLKFSNSFEKAVKSGFGCFILKGFFTASGSCREICFYQRLDLRFTDAALKSIVSLFI